MSVDIKTLAVELQSLGVRTTVPTAPGDTRAGGRPLRRRLLVGRRRSPDGPGAW